MKYQNKKSLSRSIAIRFILIIFLTNVCFIISMFFVIRHLLADKDQNIAIARFNEISKVIEVNGIETLKAEAEKGLFNKLEDLLIVIRDHQGHRLYEKLPTEVKHFNPKEIQKSLLKAETQDGLLTIYPEDAFEETIETYSGNSSSYRLTVGISTDASEDFLNMYFQLALALTLVSGVISILLGYYSTKKSLEPIRQLISTVKLVQEGKLVTLENLGNSKDELSELIDLFNEMIVKIKKLILSLQTSLDAIAHDLRTPLTHISNKLESLHNDDIKITKETVGDLMEETQSITSLVNTLLEITEANSKSLLLRKESFQLLTLIQECVDLYEYISEEKKAIIKIVCDETITIHADRNKLKRVLANLLDNALKYSFNTPEILIQCEKHPDSLVLSIKDNGVGISENDMNQIWQRLYRGDSSRTTPGIGLGLSFVKSIIDAHGWTIEVESDKTSGSKFIVIIKTTPASM